MATVVVVVANTCKPAAVGWTGGGDAHVVGGDDEAKLPLNPLDALRRGRRDVIPSMVAPRFGGRGEQLCEDVEWNHARTPPNRSGTVFKGTMRSARFIA